MSRRRDAIDEVLDAQTKGIVAAHQRGDDHDDRLRAVEDRLRPSQADAIREAGLPAGLVATEANVWKRLSPARNRWPEIAAFDERVAELLQRQAEKASELRDLRDREIGAPAADADRLATWQLDGEQGATARAGATRDPRTDPRAPGRVGGADPRDRKGAGRQGPIRGEAPRLSRQGRRQPRRRRAPPLPRPDRPARRRPRRTGGVTTHHRLGPPLPQPRGQQRAARPARRRQTPAARGDGADRIRRSEPGAGCAQGRCRLAPHRRHPGAEGG